MRTDWQSLPFGGAVSDESGGNIKTPQSEFQAAGRFPIVDQGKELISGYTDDPERICKAPLPVIVFGDHTRCFKFIDFPFCMGADGVKVLRPRIAVHEKYLFHYLRSLHLPNAGYDWHFKYLKRTEVKLPPLAEQRRIAAILDQAEALRAKRRHALTQLDTLTQSLFLNLFGHPIQNEKGWPIGELGSVARVERGKFTPRPRNDPTYYDGPFPFIQTGDISSSEGRLKLWSQTLNEKGIAVSRSFPPGTVVVAIVGATLGITAILDIEVYCPDSVIGIQVHSDKASSEYIERVLRFWRPIFVAQAPETARANINLETLRPLRIPLPPLPLQREFAAQVSAVERLKASQRASLAKLDALFASLQYRAFRGEL